MIFYYSCTLFLFTESPEHVCKERLFKYLFHSSYHLKLRHRKFTVCLTLIINNFFSEVCLIFFQRKSAECWCFLLLLPQPSKISSCTGSRKAAYRDATSLFCVCILALSVRTGLLFAFLGTEVFVHQPDSFIRLVNEQLELEEQVKRMLLKLLMLSTDNHPCFVLGNKLKIQW